MTAPLPSRRLFGFRISPVTMGQMFDLMDRAIAADSRMVLASQNLHGLYIHARDPEFRALHEDPATCVHIDGMPIVWLGRVAGLGLGGAHRTTWVDFFPPLMDLAERKCWRVFYLGAEPAVLETGLARLRARHPRLVVEGRDGFFDQAPGSPGNEETIARINAFRPHLLVVGMGMGRQERWIRANRDRIEANVVATSGACIEYFADAVKMPPRWLGRVGLEWAFRLYDDPGRFWRRYLVEPWFVAGYLAANVLRQRGRLTDPPPAAG
jgi:N-acetylglucosaminyldiphosphoundecaprenol N-acetyl-beta-D-mannosaminyltransferase